MNGEITKHHGTGVVTTLLIKGPPATIMCRTSGRRYTHNGGQGVWHHAGEPEHLQGLIAAAREAGLTVMIQ